MVNRLKLVPLLLAVFCSFWQKTDGFGACNVPYALLFQEKKTTSVRIKWSDGNINPLGWELEVVPRNMAPSGKPNQPIATTRDITLANLQPSTAYNLYIRTVCSPGQYSNWNVAIPFTTVLSNPTECQVQLPLKDNSSETFLIDNTETGILGVDLFLHSVDLIVEHDWPADLKITLESPQGQRLVLSANNGTINDDFGDIGDGTCRRVTRFSPDACLSIKEFSPPFIGTFKTEGTLQQWKPETLAGENWKLIIADRAIKDVGTLRYVRLNFSRQSCIAPANFTITSVDNNQIVLEWDQNQPCKTVKIGVRVNGVPGDTIFIACSEEKYIYRNLNPDSDYEFFITSICQGFVQSAESCRIKTRTRCEKVTLAESFDDLTLCGEGCGTACPDVGKIWMNASGNDTQDWLVWRGPTDTDNTGPDGDIQNLGNYLYLENNPTICAPSGFAILQSQCIDIRSNASQCDMSFYYHMYGSDVDTLWLEISVDDGASWETLFEESGNQGNVWTQAFISLASFHNKKARFRFRANTGEGALGDIAIDGIEFYGSRLSVLPIRYYRDRDLDGIGTPDEYVELCSSAAPVGYALLTGDCDDSDNTIHPGNVEILCNGKDENCNGLADDQDALRGIQIETEIQPVACNGLMDGRIAALISGGKPPYTVTWSTGATGDTLQGVSPGFYAGFVTDSTGCIAQIPLQEVKTATILNIVNTGLIQPTCQGKRDGAIFIEHNSEVPPYTYLWSDGSTAKYLTNTGEGIYSVTVTDNAGCFSVLRDITLAAKPSLVTNIKQLSQPLCFGQTTGKAELITVNGIPPYTYQWSHGVSGAAISNLAQGTYQCTISDSQGCRQVFPVEIKAPEKVTVTVISTEDVRCFGEVNGSIKTNTAGGKPPYTFFWNHFQFTDDVFELGAGQYTLTVTDANGCSVVSQPIQISQPAPFLLSLDTLLPATCLKGSNGTASVSATGGNGGFNFLWSHSNTKSPLFTDLTPGDYTVTAYDQFGCKSTQQNFTVGYLNKPLAVVTQVVDTIRCHNAPEGSISVHVMTGSPPFDFNWSHGYQYFANSGKDTIGALRPGQYVLTVTDQEGCTAITDAMVLPNKPPLIYQVSRIENNPCAGDTLARIEVRVTGGTPPLRVTWNDGVRSGFNLVSLPDGTYRGRAVDSSGCTLDFAPILLTAASNMVLRAQITHAAVNAATGKICMTIDGGIPPYAFLWSNGLTGGPCLDKLSPGSYQVTITDAAGCAATDSYLIEQKSGTLAEDEKTGMYLYPNPADQWISLYSAAEVENVVIFSATGLQSANCGANEASEFGRNIPVSCLPPGLYFLQVRTREGKVAALPFLIIRQ